jgi:deazaflavin-dependent oxidoreductase (nitroreductase family)
MGAEKLKSALQGTREVELTTTGRKTGDESTRPIWFVEEGDRLLLLPVTGSDSSWYRNVQANPEIGLAACGADLRVRAETTEDPAQVQHVIEAFGDKYGADQVEELYPKKNAAVAVSLG